MDLPLIVPDILNGLLAICARHLLASTSDHQVNHLAAPQHDTIRHLLALLTVAPDMPMVKDIVIPSIPSLSMNSLSRQGVTHGLDWWRAALGRFGRRNTSQKALQVANPAMTVWYSEVAMDAASANGHVRVLDWWWSSCLELKYTAMAMHLAVLGGHADVVRWWEDHACGRLPLKLEFRWLFFYAMDDDRMDLLIAWTDTYGLPCQEDLETNPTLAQRATEKGKVQWLRWMQSKVPDFAYAQQLVLKYAIEGGGLAVTKWWLEESKLPVTVDFLLALDMASRKDDIELLEYVATQLNMRSDGIDREEWMARFYTEEAMDSATYRGALATLDWWGRSGLQLKYSSELVISETLAWSDRIQPETRLWAMLDWWLYSGLHVDVDVSTIGWWKEPGKRWWAVRKYERLKAGGGWVTKEEALEGLAEQSP